MEERSELCHRALRIRHERLEGTLSDVAPILWQHGALARLDKGEPIDKLCIMDIPQSPLDMLVYMNV